MDEHNLKELWTGVDALRPILERFAALFAYRPAPRGSLGRYPRIRLERDMLEATVWIEFGMGLDREGRRFEKLSPLVTYELGGGAFTDRRDAETIYRYSLRHLAFEGTDVKQASDRMACDLPKVHHIISSWRTDDLLSAGERFPIGGSLSAREE